VAFLDAGTPPVYAGLGGMRVAKDHARAAIEAIRAQGRRALVAHGGGHLALIDDRDDYAAPAAVGDIGDASEVARHLYRSLSLAC
jgi:vancomycin aglycone glucosyltransferase